MKIPVVVKAGARTEKVERLADGSLKVSVKAPPHEGRANDAAVRAVARFFSVPPSRVTILRGLTTSRKIFSIG